MNKFKFRFRDSYIHIRLNLNLMTASLPIYCCQNRFKKQVQEVMYIYMVKLKPVNLFFLGRKTFYLQGSYSHTPLSPTTFGNAWQLGCKGASCGIALCKAKPSVCRKISTLKVVLAVKTLHEIHKPFGRCIIVHSIPKRSRATKRK